MHIVFASSLVPCGAPESGFEIANQAIADGLRRNGARVTYLGFQWPGTTLSEPQDTVCLGAIDVKTASATRRQNIAWLLKAVQAGLPFASAKLRVIADQDMRSALERLRPFDGLIVNGTPIGGAFEAALTASPYFYVAHNVEHQTAAQAADHATGLVERVMYRREARLLKALEQRLIDGAAHILTLSGEDKLALGLEGSDKASVVPMVTPMGEPMAGTRVPAFDIGLIGSWTWTPNRIGLEWFLQHVMPLMPKTATVAVAGALPSGFPQRDDRVRFLGRVIDAKQFARQCRVIALTARAGTGVQLKTIEAFEMGLPAVATPASLRGIAAVPDNVMMAETAADYGAALMDMVVAHRTGAVADLDGMQFREGQISAMDKVFTGLIHPASTAVNPLT